MSAYEAESGALALRTHPLPLLSDKEVLIRTHAIGINRADIFQRQGSYAPPPGASSILGLEAAGEIVALGKKITNLSVGDRVATIVPGGAYAEYVASPAELLLPLPASLSYAEAACFPEALFTAWLSVIERGKIKKGERFLMHGGTSGIGVITLQLLKSLGIICYATAGSDEKCQWLERELGVDLAINYRTENFVERIREHTQNQGIDCILDMVGGSYLEKNFKLLRYGGRLSMIAFLENARIDQCNLAPLLMKNLTLTGSTLRSQPPKTKRALHHAILKRAWPLVVARTIRPIIDSTFPFKNAADAHKRMESGQHLGKIILQC